MQLGIDGFVEHIGDPVSGATISAAERLRQLIAEAVCADESGLDVVAIGEHHRSEYRASAPAVDDAARRGAALDRESSVGTFARLGG